MIEINRYIQIPIKLISGLFILLLIAPCPSMGQSKADPELNNNLSTLNKQNLGGFKWMNEPVEYLLTDGQLTITADQGSDFFVNPEDRTSTATAPYFYQEVKGNFVAIARVEPNFAAVWNACSLLVHLDEVNWIKFAFENSDATGPSIVSVVTRGVSDDANGPILNEQKSLWLKIIRKGAIYAMHWSADGENFSLARLAALPDQESVKIGMEAQCPSEGPAAHVFSYFSIENKTVEDLRKGY